MTLSANDRHILIRVKIERAKKHLGDLEISLARYRDKRFYVSIPNSDLQAGEATDEAGLGKFSILPFDAIACAGDITHNLRSALDHLANHLVWVGSGKEPSRRVEFPIAKNATTYKGDKAGKVEGMIPEVVELIDALKPYKGGNDSLWRLHELNNIDKHRTLFTTRRDRFFCADWLTDPFFLKTGDPLFTGIFDGQVEQDMEFEIDKSVANSQIAEGDAILPTLHHLVKFVENLVLEFKPFLA